MAVYNVYLFPQDKQEDSKRAAISSCPCDAFPKQKGIVACFLCFVSKFMFHLLCFLILTDRPKWVLEDLKMHLFSLLFSSDDCEGAAGVEDSSLHLKLEKRKGIFKNLSGRNSSAFLHNLST